MFVLAGESEARLLPDPGMSLRVSFFPMMSITLPVLRTSGTATVFAGSGALFVLRVNEPPDVIDGAAKLNPTDRFTESFFRYNGSLKANSSLQ